MKPLSLRGVALASLALASVLPASVLPVPAKARQFQVTVHVRQPGGGEESIAVSDFQFVYYERRFIRHPTGFGKPAELETRDLTHEARFLQNEDSEKAEIREDPQGGP